jgi:hypothetical protein
MTLSKKSKKNLTNKTKKIKQNTKKIKKTRVNNTHNASAISESLLDFKSSKSLTSLSKPSDIKSTTSVGQFYNLIDIYDKINKYCIAKVKSKIVDGIALTKKVSADICTCLFEKNKDMTIETLETKTNKQIHTPGSSCINILDKFIKNEKLKQINPKKSQKSIKSIKSIKSKKSKSIYK